MNRLKPDLLIALGGGSSIDCAKGILLAAENRPVFAAIPTTSGTGSEVTSFSILTLNGVKHPLVDKSIRPDYAVLDETLLEKLPPSLVADSGMDAIFFALFQNSDQKIDLQQTFASGEGNTAFFFKIWFITNNAIS